MLGSKLRAWMESHIGRPRKKGSTKGKKGAPPDELKEPIPDTPKEQNGMTVVSRLEPCPAAPGPPPGANLSSPESAYSTGYSTDGTSPGASIPPEYYINLRSGKHYYMPPKDGLPPPVPTIPPPPTLPPPRVESPLTPRSRRRAEAKRKQRVPESSTEEDLHDRHRPPHKVPTPKSIRRAVGVHRRTESMDGEVPEWLGERVGSPGLGATGSPRQRTRIRTNPWLGSTGRNGASPHLSSAQESSCSSSTTSSTKTRGPPPTQVFSPRHLPRGPIEEICVRSPVLSNPLANRPTEPVTTCSPIGDRPCRHLTRPQPVSTSSSSSPPSSDQGPSSDLSDDERTLHSQPDRRTPTYTHHKETDILSDSDPTDQEHFSHDEWSASGSGEDSSDSQDREGSGKYRGRANQGLSAGRSPEHMRRRAQRKAREGRDGPDERRPSQGRRRSRRSCSVRNGEGSPRRPRDRGQASAGNSPCRQPVTRNPHPDQHRQPLNLNKVLIDRLMQPQRAGTRSADCTPVSLRKLTPSDYNGKYLRNPHVSRLINSSNTSLGQQAPREGESKLTEVGHLKQRSNSLSRYEGPPPPTAARIPEHRDKEGDLLCRKLIMEAQTMLQGYPPRQEYLSPTPSLRVRSAMATPTHGPHSRPLPPIDISSQIDLLQQKINNNKGIRTEAEEGILKSISRTLEKMMVSRKPKENCLGSPYQERRDNRICEPQVRTASITPLYTRSPVFRSAPTQEMSPAFRKKMLEAGRGVDYIRTIEPGSPRPPDRQPDRNFNVPMNRVPDRSNRVHPLSQMKNSKSMGWPEDESLKSPALGSFKSIDLGPLAVSSQQCPLSEPVKRKVYSHSSTLDKLAKTLRKRDVDRHLYDLPIRQLREENSNLKDKVAQLRRERLQVEARVRDTQEQIDKLKYSDNSGRC